MSIDANRSFSPKLKQNCTVDPNVAHYEAISSEFTLFVQVLVLYNYCMTQDSFEMVSLVS